ncbi:hypothetical protein Misp02_33680 [Microtetraspora sp. NBRC 16547]|nr:hypothetical protein Misp02_33680 [Microtetraspora sp. NBRC 16547]
MLAPQILADVAGELLAQQACRDALEGVDQGGQSHLGRIVDQQMHVVAVAVELDQFRSETVAHLDHDLLAA